MSKGDGIRHVEKDRPPSSNNNINYICEIVGFFGVL